MEAKAVARYVRVSPFKARLVIDQIRGVSVEEALNILHFSKKAAAVPIEKTLRSAVANLLQKEGGDASIPPERFVVSQAIVDDGATMKRWIPRSMGRAHPILKRTSHITVQVSDGLSEAVETEEE
jgi:large subunit ribosomal protein L22